MMIGRISELSGKHSERNIPVDPDRFHKWSTQGINAPLIQVEFPDLSPDDREFIMTGITPDEWDEMMGPEIDDQPLEDEPPF